MRNHYFFQKKKPKNLFISMSPLKMNWNSLVCTRNLSENLEQNKNKVFFTSVKNQILN